MVATKALEAGPVNSGQPEQEPSYPQFGAQLAQNTPPGKLGSAEVFCTCLVLVELSVPPHKSIRTACAPHFSNEHQRRRCYVLWEIRKAGFMYYWMQPDNRGEWRWVLKAANHEPIAVSSEGYKREADCLHAINLVKSSKDAPVYKQS